MARARPLLPLLLIFLPLVECVPSQLVVRLDQDLFVKESCEQVLTSIQVCAVRASSEGIE
jgi:hypothetical protein